MPKQKKPKLTLIKGGVKSFDVYKRMMNTMSQFLLGRPMTASAEAAKNKDDKQDGFK